MTDLPEGQAADLATERRRADAFRDQLAQATAEVVPSCVNPDHLFLGTNFDNVKDAINKGRRGDGREASATRYTKD